MRLPHSPGNGPLVAPIRGKPLIFAAMATMDQTDEPKPPSIVSAPIQSYFEASASPPSTPRSPPPLTHNHAHPSQQKHDPQPPYNPLYSHVINGIRPPTRMPSSAQMRPQDAQSPVAIQEALARPPSQIQPIPSAQPRPRKLSKAGPLPTPPTIAPITTAPPARSPLPPTPPQERQQRSVGRQTSHSQIPHLLTKARPPGTTSPVQTPPAASEIPETHVDQRSHERERAARGTSLQLLDHDPFARNDGVRMLKPGSREGRTPPSREGTSQGVFWGEEVKGPLVGQPVQAPVQAERPNTGPDVNAGPITAESDVGMPAPTPSAPGTATGLVEAQRPSWWMVPRPQPESKVAGSSGTQGYGEVAADADQVNAYTKVPMLLDCLKHPNVLGPVLVCLTFAEWSVLSCVSRELRILLQKSDDLREEVLERYLSTVGYRRWSLPTPEPLSLSLKVPIT